MNNLFVNKDGANCQAQAVLAYLSGHDGVEASWSTKHKEYQARPEVNRWHNCREQGYVVSMRNTDPKGSLRQLNIAFFEHRNSDAICAIRWEQVTTNPPTIDTADFEKNNIYKDKYDTTFDVGFAQPFEMADWVMDQLEIFWKEANG